MTHRSAGPGLALARLDLALARLDLALVHAGVFDSRVKAQEAIEAGLVSVDGRPVLKPSERVTRGAHLEAEPLHPWVSRGGLKLTAALDHFEIDPRGCICLDVGASTGGFTDVLLTRGAARVYAVDVGHGQLHERLRADPRVVNRPGIDARSLSSTIVPEAPKLVVCDASFISLTMVLPSILAIAAPTATLIALIKPQFEVGRGGTRKGIVRDGPARERACSRVAALIAELGWRVLGVVPSPVTGRDGNVEFLIGAVRP